MAVVTEVEGQSSQEHATIVGELATKPINVGKRKEICICAQRIIKLRLNAIKRAMQQTWKSLL